jgi:excinuclease UvrABC nuclease subunit
VVWQKQWQISGGNMIQINIPEIEEMVKISHSEIPTNISGVYLIYDENLELCYVGKSKDIRSRIFSHLNEYTVYHQIPPDKEYTFSIVPIKDELERISIEAIYINHYKPRYNLHPVKSYWYKDLRIDVEMERTARLKD